jgi:succinate dehydrogenase / fumarate reductase cytochrome b subunit
MVHGSTSPAPAKSAPSSLHFWIRRLHSLSGILPLGVFLFFHLSANVSVLSGHFDESVRIIHLLDDLGLLVPVEVLFILLPLAFHAGVGLWIAQSARLNHGIYRYPENRRYSAQRITAWIATVFILYHLYHMHWVGRPLAALGGAQFDPHNATETAARAMQKAWYIPWFYAIGVASTVFHFANGLWTFLITWGVTVGQRAQRASTAVCAFIGILMGLMGLGAVAGFSFHDTQGAPAIEQQHAAAEEK